jgi:hypothetical protein
MPHLMTTEERLDRIEHITAGIAEERRKDRDEYKGLWRDTQRQLNEMGARLLQMSEENQEADRRLEARIDQLAERTQATIAQLAEEGRASSQRIDKMVSGMGEFMRQISEKLAEKR